MIITLPVEDLFMALCRELDLSSSTVSYCLKRFRSEGLTFLTVTLPKLADAILRSLNLGYFDRSGLTCFRWKGRALAEFRELTDEVFDSAGLLLIEPCPVAIYRVRQLSHYLYKLALEIDESKIKAAEQSFIQTDNDLHDCAYNATFVDDLRKAIETAYAFPSIFQVLDENRPRCGPGTYSVDKKLRRKSYSLPYYRFKKSTRMGGLPVRFKSVSGYFKAYPSSPIGHKFVDNDSSNSSELLFVPKDSRGPRSIVREPLHLLRLQMAFFDWFSRFLERGTDGRINFTDQQVNRKLAEQGSRDGSWATFDLKDASDRVSYEVVRRLSDFIPVLRYFSRCRSQNVRLPSGAYHRLNKLAGMGSGLTFAWLAFLVHSSVSLEISKRTNLSFKQAGRLVYVYGDDLVVPTYCAPYVTKGLQNVGLLVNDRKSFANIHIGRKSYFRESCGGDYFGGEDVSIVRAKFSNSKPFYSADKRNLILSGPEAVIQVNEHAKELVKNGLLQLAECYYHALEKAVGKLPTVSNFESSVIARYTATYVDWKPDNFGNYPLIKVIVPKAVLEDECFEQCPDRKSVV